MTPWRHSSPLKTDYIPYAYVQVIREAIGTDKMEGKIFDGPVWIQAQQVIRYFEDTFHASYNIRDPRTNATHVVDNWPPIMFAELATNCILHKEYSKHNCVEIAKGRAAQEQLISHNLPLVMTIAGEKYKSVEYLDRVQAGNMGLLKAVQYFNPYRGNAFTTYAAYLIDSEISDYSRSLRKQKAASPAEECFVATDEDIERVVDLMGGKYWMREITVDTDQTPDRIRKQIAVLLQEKKRMESVANDSIHGPRELTDEEYDDVLEEAVQSRTGRVQRKKRKASENSTPFPDVNRRIHAGTWVR